MHQTDLHPVAAREEALLAPYAFHSIDSAGRQYDEAEHPYRGPFQRDRDRIVHAAAFRRLSGKTQVFTGNMGDYHRTRLTHTMEVASIARTIGRVLRLNEDLVEALALLHDIGHPPFGHAGEDALNECLVQDGGFSHNEFALTIVQQLEHPYSAFPGLNLSREVLESQACRVDKMADSSTPLLEAQVVDMADSIAYDAHDVDDAVKLKLLSLEQLLEVPLIRACYDRVTARHGRQLSGKMLRRTLVHELIDTQVWDLLQASEQALQAQALESARHACQIGIRLRNSPQVTEMRQVLEAFLYEHVYRHPQLVTVRAEAQQRLRRMFATYTARPERLPEKFRQRAQAVGVRRAAADYLAGMTDRFCQDQYQALSMTGHAAP